MSKEDIWGARFQRLAEELAEDQVSISLSFGGGLLNFGTDVAERVFNLRWQDGHRLSERIWDFAKATENDILKQVFKGINEGLSAESIAKGLKQYLTSVAPGDGMTPRKRALRLARSETNKAYQLAHEMIAKESPLVEGVYLVRSANGDPDCPICLELVGEVGGSEGADRTLYQPGDVPDRHPNCMCHMQDKLVELDKLAAIMTSNDGL